MGAPSGVISDHPIQRRAGHDHRPRTPHSERRRAPAATVGLRPPAATGRPLRSSSVGGSRPTRAFSSWLSL